MSDVFELMLYGFQNIMRWMSEIEYAGINVLMVCFVALFLSLIWGFILSPIFGNRGGSLSIGLSDVVSRSETRDYRSEIRNHRNSR